MPETTFPLWKLTAGNLSASFSFDSDLGVTLTSLENAAGDRVVDYVRHPRSLHPFPVKEDEQGNHVTPLSPDEARFSLQDVQYGDGVWGGRPVKSLSITYSYRFMQLTFHAVAFPGVSVLRNWFSIKNIGLIDDERLSVVPLSLNLYNDDYKNVYHARYLHGGNANYDHGLMVEKVLGPGRELQLVDIESMADMEYVPWLVLNREESPSDGLMIAMDYIGRWHLTAHRSQKAAAKDRGDAVVRFTIDKPDSVRIRPGDTLDTPAITWTAFTGNMDNLMKELYDWQYEYMWDLTNDKFSLTRGISYWVYCSRNLHEQFIYRCSTNPLMGRVNQKLGYEMFWDDAGWSTVPGWPIDGYASVFKNNYEGPDFRHAQRFYQKSGIKWLLWFSGSPSRGLLETKAGAWGTFEWRTDGLEERSLEEEYHFKKGIEEYLLADSRRSFHSCNGGSNCSHSFDIQRLGNFHYLADCSTGPYKSYYFSYFEVPDKWGDITTTVGGMRSLSYEGGSGFAPPIEETSSKEKAHQLDNSLTMKLRGSMIVPEFDAGELIHVPFPCNYTNPDDHEHCRELLEIYRYLKEKGVAGRWSYMFHPEVRGEHEYQIMQRMSHDLLRGMIIPRRRARKSYTVYPAGLPEKEIYTVTFRNSNESFTRTGKELYEQGIRVENPTDGELILLNLPDFPGKSAEEAVLSAPMTVLQCREEALGYFGTGIYWTPAHGEGALSRYEISKNGKLLDEVSLGKYYFDTAAPQEKDVYAVRAVSRSGGRSAWTIAQKIESGVSESYSAMGLFGENMSTAGWYAEFSKDLKSFEPMTFVPPADCPYADFGGTPNQQGGIEGWWVAGKCGKVGHGWMQATSDGWCVRRFVCPHDGVVTVTGRAMKEWYHQDVPGELRAGVLLNDSLVGEWKILRANDLIGGDWLESISVKAGDSIRFVLSPASPEKEEECPWEKGANLVGWLSMIRYQKPEQQTSAKTAETEGGRGRQIHRELKVPNGLYTLKLRFDENEYKFSKERLMRLSINGEIVEKELDIRHDSLGKDVLEKTWHYIVPEQGVVTVDLEALTEADAVLTSVTLCNELRDTIRINCGGGNFIDWAGALWQADSFYEGGASVQAETGSLMQASPTLYDRDLYFTARSGKKIQYRIPVCDGLYSVQLKFAELWQNQPGDRRMDIFICGKQIRSRWDPLESAGLPHMTADMRQDDVRPENGYITVDVVSRSELPAILQAIEIE